MASRESGQKSSINGPGLNLYEICKYHCCPPLSSLSSSSAAFGFLNSPAATVIVLLGDEVALQLSYCCSAKAVAHTRNGMLRGEIEECREFKVEKLICFAVKE